MSNFMAHVNCEPSVDLLSSDAETESAADSETKSIPSYKSLYATYFLKKFQLDSYEETVSAYYNSEKKKYGRFTLDIGWSMKKVNGPKKLANNVHRYKKKCNGALYCAHEACRLKDTRLRPGHDEKTTMAIREKGCYECGSVLEHIPCDVDALYFFRIDKCNVKQNGRHTHKKYLAKHLSEKVKLKDLLSGAEMEDLFVVGADFKGFSGQLYSMELIDGVFVANPIGKVTFPKHPKTVRDFSESLVLLLEWRDHLRSLSDLVDTAVARKIDEESYGGISDSRRQIIRPI